MLYRRIVILLLLFASLQTLASSQSVSPENARSLSSPEYVIEVHMPSGCLFAPIKKWPSRPATKGAAASSAPEFVQLAGSLTYTLPRPTYYLPDSSGRPIVSNVTFWARQKGEAWNFVVTVGVGEFYDAGSEKVADLMLQTNERAEVEGVARFGLTPYRVAVLKVLDSSGRKPHVNNKTQSLSLEKLEVGTLPEPHRLSLKNNSDKPVLALQYNTFKEGKFLLLRWREIGPTQPLVKPGAVYRLEVANEDATCGDTEGYRTSQADSINISSVVFADGSYEGEPGLAALIRGQAMGNKQELAMLVPTLEAFVDGGDVGQLIYQLRNLSGEMVEVAEPALVERLQNSLPPPPPGRSQPPDGIVFLTNLIRSGQHEIKTSLLGDAQFLEDANKTQNPEHIKRACAYVVTKYKDWLAAAEAAAP